MNYACDGFARISRQLISRGMCKIAVGSDHDLLCKSNSNFPEIWIVISDAPCDTGYM